MIEETRIQRSLATVQYWQDAVNTKNAERLIELSDSDIEIVGPRGSAYGHQVIRQWLERAVLTLTTLRIFVRGNVIVLAQCGVWRSVESGEVIGEADVASEFKLENQKVAKYARYDTLGEAFEKTGLDFSDEQFQN